MGQLVPHPDNPRLRLREDVIERLTVEIQRTGFGPEHAPLVRPYGDGFQIISGHHRVEAMKRSGLDPVMPCWVKEMDDDEAYILLALANTQGEHSKLERAVHVYGFGKRGEHGRGKKGGLSEYARRFERPQQRVSEQYAVGELVENYRISGSFLDLVDRDPYSQLLEVTKAPPEAREALINRLLSSGWTVADTQHHVQQIKGFSIPSEWAFWLPLDKVIRHNLATGEFSSKTVSRLIAVADQTATWIMANAHEPEETAAQFYTWLRVNAGGKSWEPRAVAEYLQKLIASQFVVEGWHQGDWRDHIDALDDGTVGLLLTDPPYGQGFQSDYRLDRRVDRKHDKISSDGTAADAEAEVLAALEAFEPKLADNAHVLVFCSWAGEPGMREVLAKAGYTLRGSLIWDKQATGMGDPETTFAPAHERILHAVKGSPPLYRRAADVLRHRRCDSSRHPTEKPESLLEELIDATTAEGQLVADPFGGVASVPAAAKQSGRRWWGCELEEKYWQLGEERLS